MNKFKSVIDSKWMFEHACAFVDFAESVVKEPNSIQNRTYSHNVVYIVNASFACEVYLKILLLQKGESEKQIKKYRHDIAKLWAGLKQPDMSASTRIEKTISNHFDSLDEQFFDKNLNHIADAFCDWRYIYEKKGACLNVHFLMNLMFVLRNECCLEIYGKPWSEYIESCIRTNEKISKE